MHLRVRRSQLEGNAAIPGSKSHTIRALVIAGLAEGTSHLTAPLLSSDTEASVQTMRQFGARVERDGDSLFVEGVAGHPNVPNTPLDVGNSGTTLYIAAVTAALANGTTLLTGDEQIQARPIQALLDAICDLGADAQSVRGNGCAPVEISGPLLGGRTTIECPTSQYLTALLLNCPLATGDTEIDVPLLHERPYVEMTLDWMARQNIVWEADGLQHFRIPGCQRYTAFDRHIPADFSSAAFFMCAAAVTGSEVTLTGLDMNDPQGDKAVVDMLRAMGTEIDIRGTEMTIHGGNLHGCKLDLNATPDALPALAVTACFAEGETLLGNVPQARLKETDRLAVMAAELKKMGADLTELSDGLVIRRSQLHGASVNGHGDHRVVMSLAVAGMGATGDTVISTAESVAVTFPNFVELMQRLGADLEQVDTP